MVGGLFAGLWSVVEYVGEKLQGHNMLSEDKGEEGQKIKEEGYRVIVLVGMKYDNMSSSSWWFARKDGVKSSFQF